MIYLDPYFISHIVQIHYELMFIMRCVRCANELPKSECKC